MAEFVNTGTQTVAVDGNVIFTETVIKPCCKVTHRNSSGIFILKNGRYLVGFNANVSGATAGTEIDLAITLNGEPILATVMASTPAVANDLNNVSAWTYIDVDGCCCFTVTVENTGTTAATVNNANLIIIREE